MNDAKHWLVRPATIRLLWRVFIAVLSVIVLGDLGIHGQPVFGVDTIFGFYAWYGFATCVAMIVFAKALGVFLKRGDTYYDD
jgi:hypothetical protein